MDHIVISAVFINKCKLMFCTYIDNNQRPKL